MFEPVEYGAFTISATTFKGCTALTKITLSSKVKEIGKQAFLNCKGLKTIAIKTKILLTKKGKVGAEAFKGIAEEPTVSCPKGTAGNYKKLLRKKGVPKKAAFTDS